MPAGIVTMVFYKRAKALHETLIGGPRSLPMRKASSVNFNRLPDSDHYYVADGGIKGGVISGYDCDRVTVVVGQDSKEFVRRALRS
jgi:hypothetical protein